MTGSSGPTDTWTAAEAQARHPHRGDLWFLDSGLAPSFLHGDRDSFGMGLGKRSSFVSLAFLTLALKCFSHGQKFKQSSILYFKGILLELVLKR